MANRPTRPSSLPPDQADGLRRLFGGASVCAVPLVANPHVAATAVAIEQLAAAFGAWRREVLVVDAADTSPPAPEAATLGLAGGIQAVSAGLGYLPARGLPRRFVDARGSASRLLDELQEAAPQAGVLLVHGEVMDLARIFRSRPARPVLLAADQSESVKHAYACWKLLARRCGWLSADLLLLVDGRSARPPQIAASVAQCADEFIGGALAGWAAIDPSAQQRPRIDDALHDLAAGQLQRDDALLAGALPGDAGLLNPLRPARRP